MLFTLPLETGLGLYSGRLGIGGGAGKSPRPDIACACAKFVAPKDFGLCCSCFFARYPAGNGLVPMFPDFRGLSTVTTGLGPSFIFGFGSR
jgi:hypothetical protein